MPTAEVVLPDKKVHRTVLDDPPQRLIQYLDNKLGLKQPVQPTELSDSLRDVLLNDEARFERLTQDIYKIYEDYYARDGDPDGKVSLEDYRGALQKRLAREQKNQDGKKRDRREKQGEQNSGDFEFPVQTRPIAPPGDLDSERDLAQDSGDKPETDKDQEIAIYQLAIGALALFLLISIAR